MKLHLTTAGTRYNFTGYGDGYVLVNQQRFERSLILLPERVIPDWGVASAAELTPTQVEFLAALEVEILLLGTGRTLQFPDPALLRPLARAGIGAEVMDTSAACRTFNILVAEDRRAAAAVVIA
ncbi:MAG: Mth938-like domain-containing protein [Pseudomonadota bacterium]